MRSEKKEAFEPIYKRIARCLLQSIQDGTYPSNQLIPSETELAEQFEASRMTVRKAIEHLASQGYLCTRKGKGTYVTNTKLAGWQDGLVGFTESLKKKGLTPSSKIVKFKRGPLSKTVAELLHLTTFPEVYDIRRVRCGNEEALLYEEVVLLSEYAPGLTEQDVVGSIFDYLERNVRIGYANQSIEAVAADEQISKLLDVPRHQPVLLVTSITFLPNGSPVLYSKSYYRSDVYKFNKVIFRGQMEQQ